MRIKSTIEVIGSQMDLGAFRKGVDMGPLAIRHAGLLKKMKDIGYEVIDHGDVMPMVATSEGSPTMRYEAEINEANERLFEQVLKIHKRNGFPVILGGDHSIAAGSISATAQYFGNIGIIWVDAHGDFNDEEISPSGNIHGMPLSAICGCKPDSLVHFTTARVDPRKVVIIGARALDPLEIVKLQEKGVTIYSISDVHTIGIKEIIHNAISIASSSTSGIHLSFDMDAIDPASAPGVGTPVLNGLTARECFMICEALFLSTKLKGIDLVETNPLLDKRNTTGILASELILTCLGMTDY